jgi:hypothetical protein
MLKFLNKLCEKKMSFSDLIASNTALNDDSDTMHQLAEVSPVFLGKHCPE